MRFSICFWGVCVLLTGCRQTGTPPVASSTIHRLIDSLGIGKTKNLLIYTINPNDCISCIAGFKSIDKDLSGQGHQKLLVFNVEREIEKKEFQKNIQDIDLRNSGNQKIIWSGEIYHRINRYLQKSLPIALVCVYSYEKDSILFSKPIREITDEGEIREHLAKIP